MLANGFVGIDEVNSQHPPMHDLEWIDAEVGHLAMLCGIALLQPGVVEAIFRNDDRVCLVPHRRAWNRLRELLICYYDAPDGSIGLDGSPSQTEPLRQRAEQVRDRMQPRYLPRSTNPITVHHWTQPAVNAAT